MLPTHRIHQLAQAVAKLHSDLHCHCGAAGVGLRPPTTRTPPKGQLACQPGVLLQCFSRCRAHHLLSRMPVSR